MDWLVSCLLDCLFDLIDWLVVCLLCSSIGLVDWLIVWLSSRMYRVIACVLGLVVGFDWLLELSDVFGWCDDWIDCLRTWFVYWLIGWNVWLIDWLIDLMGWLIDWLAGWFVVCLSHWYDWLGDFVVWLVDRVSCLICVLTSCLAWLLACSIDLIERLICSIGWVIDELLVWLIVWLFVWLVDGFDWLIDWFGSFIFHWIVYFDWLLSCFFDWLLVCLMWLTSFLIDC